MCDWGRFGLGRMLELSRGWIGLDGGLVRIGDWVLCVIREYL